MLHFSQSSVAFGVGCGLKYVCVVRVYVECVLHQSGGDQYVDMFGSPRGNLGVWPLQDWRGKLKFPYKLLLVFFLILNQKESVFCLRMCERVSEVIMLVLVFQQRCNEESVWNLETDEILCIFINSTFRHIFYLLFIQLWRVLTSSYIKLKSDLASDTSPSYKRRPADHFEVPCKHLCSGWIQTFLNRTVVSHVVCTFSWYTVGNKTKNIVSNQVPFCRSDKHGVTSFPRSIRSKLPFWKSSKSCCPLGTPAVTSFCLAT